MALDSPQILTQEARVALKRIEQGLQDAVLFHYKEREKIALYILSTFLQPTGLLWQECPLLWVHPIASPTKPIDHYSTAIAELVLLGIQPCLHFFWEESYITDRSLYCLSGAGFVWDN